MTSLKPISIWAKEHKWSSRIIIILSFLLLNFLGIITGLLFDSLEIAFSPFFIIGAMAMFLLIWFIYPVKSKSTFSVDKQKFYVFQKTCDLVLVGVTFIMFVYFGNHQTSPFNSSLFSASATNLSSSPGDSSKIHRSVADFKKMMKDENGKQLKWKERKKLMKTRIKEIKKDSSLSEGGKVALIILTILVAIGLAILLAALACSISCSGSEAAAVLVAIVGYGALVFLTILVIRSIVKKGKRDKAKAESATNQ